MCGGYRDLTRLHRMKYGGPMEVYVTSGDTIYISEVNQLCGKGSGCGDRSESSSNSNSHAETQKGPLAEVAQFDPLFNTPISIHQQEWDCSCLIMIPVRLGINTVNHIYKEVCALSVP